MVQQSVGEGGGEPQEELDRKTLQVLALLASVVFVAVVNGTMINVALPHIGQEFGASEGLYGWLVTGYSLAFGIFSAVNGRLADIWGKRRVYMMGLVALGACSVAVAVAPTLEFAIAVRAIQGAGAAALPVLGTTIIKTVVPPSRRGWAIGVILSTVGVAASLGPFLGGVLVQFVSWRAVFLVPALMLLLFPVAMRLLPRSLDEQQDTSFDVIGALLLGVGIAALVYSSTTLKGGDLGWAPLLWAGGGLAGLVAFGVWISHHERPFVAPALFKEGRYLMVCALGFLVNAGRFGSVVLVPILLTEIDGLEPIWVGGALFPGAVAIALLSTRAGAWADENGSRAPVSLGMGTMAAGALCAALFAGGSFWGVTAGLTLYGVGFALTQSPLINTATQLVPRGQEGAGIGLFMMIFFVGGGAGVALAVTMTELQDPLTACPIGFGDPEGGPYANAFLALGVASVMGLLLALALPSGRGEDVEAPVVEGAAVAKT